MDYRMSRKVALLGLAALIGGCAMDPTPAPAAQGAPQAGFRDSGADLIHEASGMRFPAKVGDAVRQSLDSTDVQDNYVLVRYTIPLKDGGEAIARIGVIQIEGMTPREHFAAYSPRILSRIAGGQMRSEGAFPIKGAVGDGYRGWFSGTDHAAGLITANFGHWSARLISDYPLAQTEEAQEAITTFATSLDWSPLYQSAAR